MTYRAFIGIGANMGSAAENCEKAISLIHDSGSTRVTKRSALYQSEPVGKADQPWFVNTTLEVHTSLDPERLLDLLLSIEKIFGRIRKEKWGPRIIDLDLLDYEGRIINSQNLTLPHPEMTQRRFVLQPLSEIAGETLHPIEKKTIFTLLTELPEKPVVKKL